MTITVEQLCDQLGLDCIGEVQMELKSVANITSAGDSQLSFLNANSKHCLTDTPLDCAVITTQSQAQSIQAKSVIFSQNPQLSFAKAVPLVIKQDTSNLGIDENAQIDQTAECHSQVSIAAGVVIEKGAVIAQGVKIGANSTIGSKVHIGQNTIIDANVSVYPNCLIGENCSIASGSVIGSPGFGIIPDGERWTAFPQLGKVIIGDDVDIGANCCIDRGALDDTVIGSGVKLDNLIQVAHNVEIGQNTVIAAMTGIAGSAKIGKNCQIGGRASIQGHISIADKVVITTCTFVNKSISKPGVYSASLSAQENSVWLKNHARLHQLDKITRQVKQHEKSLNQLLYKGERSEK